jgi:hypothetical protein
MILSVSRYVAEKEAQRLQEEQEANNEKLQAAAQALVLQAKEMVNAEHDDEMIAAEALQAVQAYDATEKQIKQENGV